MPIDITNEGGGELSWAVNIVGGTWLSVAPSSGTLGITLPPEAQADPTGLALGIYRDTIRVQSGSAVVRIPVRFRVY